MLCTKQYPVHCLVFWEQNSEVKWFSVAAAYNRLGSSRRVSRALPFVFPTWSFFLSFHFPKGFHLLQSHDSHTVHCGRHSGLSKTIIFVAVGLWLQRIELGDLWQQAQTVRWDGRRPSVRGDPRRLCWISGSGAVVGLCGATGASGLVSAALPNHLLCDLQ